MLIFLVVPLLVTIISMLGVGISVIGNLYILPLLGIQEMYQISIPVGIITVFVFFLLFYLLFGKSFESNRFKIFRYMNKQ